MRIIRFVLLLVLASQTAGFSQSDSKNARKQPDSDTVQAKTGQVQLSAVVTNDKGQPVEGLTKEDFMITEDGVQQPLSSFAMEKIEATSGSHPASQREKLAGNAAPTSSRTIVLFIDTAHISSNGLETVRGAMKRFIEEQITGQDLVAVMTGAGKPGVKGEFTSDHGKLLEELKKIKPSSTQFESFLTPALCGKVARRNPQALTLASQIIDSEERATGTMVTPSRTNPQAEASSKCMMVLLEASSRRRAVMANMGTAIERISAMPGQHLVALFTEGFSMVASGGEVAIADIRPAISNTVRAGVMIYAFDARVSMAAKQINIVSYNLTSEIQDSIRDQQQAMALLASQTGGEAFFNLDGVGDQARKMLEDNRVYYRLEFLAPSGKEPAKFRNIKISVKDHPDYRVRAQKGYAQAELR